ncbi:MAG: biopolymer transporter Tol, partial [Ignavibacteriales bacterium]
VYDIDEEEETRLTYNLRANQPAISNDGKKIIFLFQKDGTTNLGLIDVDLDSNKVIDFKQLTTFSNGEQVYNPKFADDDSYIIFDYSFHHTRDIFRVNPDSSGYREVISTNADERNPVIDKDGNLIYASDETGIFNIYKYDFNTKEKTQLTNVPGGAFMPSVSDNGDILYSGYTSSGYKIFYIDPEHQEKVIAGKNYIWKNNPPLDIYSANGDVISLNINDLKNFNDNETPDYEERTYGGVFSKLTFFPFIRYDNYNTTNKFAEKIKPGLLVTSSDMLNRYSLFAGGSINSRLERDLFLIFDYRNKLPLLFNLGIKPELSLELYNISRKTDVDIFFDPDTLSSGIINYEDTIGTNVTYSLFEVDFVAKHRIFSRNQELEFRFIFSQYSAALGSFFLPNDIGLYPTTYDTYLIGRNLQIKYKLDAVLPYRDAEINPIGAELELTYNYEFNKFNSEGEYIIEDGVLKPDYNDFNFHKLELNSKLHFPLWGNHTISAQLRGGTILGPAVPDFFDYYLGGLIGMKAYPFYAVSGNEVAWVNLTYRFPLFRNIDARAGHLYLDKIYLSVYGDFGNAWTGDFPKLNTFKKGVGTELRIQMNSYYLFPTSIFINAAYGFDKFERIVNSESITYGNEWQFYGGILFGFDI